MSEANYKELKKGGFMKQIQKDRFSLRLRVVGGQLKSNQLKKVYEISEKYGKGYVHMTARQSIEIPFIKLEDVDRVKEELKEAGLEPGACGPRVRTITACQGSAICSSGVIETTKLAEKLDQQFFARELPHKFKIGITGCKNNCLKAEENDMGIKGGLKPAWEKEECTYCGLCKVVCPAKCIQVNKSEKTLSFDKDKCVYCGKCVKGCPTDAWKGKRGYVLSFGGLFGNRIAVAKPILPIVFSDEEVQKVAEAAIEFYQEHGKPSERFRYTIERIGWDILEKKLKEVLK